MYFTIPLLNGWRVGLSSEWKINQADFTDWMLFLLSIYSHEGRISKRLFEKNKAHQIFRKTNISYPCITWWEMLVFRKIWRALFSSNTHFEIRPFALLLTKCKVSKRFQNLKLENNMLLLLPPRANEKDTKKIFPIIHYQEFFFFFFFEHCTETTTNAPTVTDQLIEITWGTYSKIISYYLSTLFWKAITFYFTSQVLISGLTVF